MSSDKTINYKKLIDNLLEMIELLEYDSMRSAGKAKINAPTLFAMYSNIERYIKKLASKKEK